MWDDGPPPRTCTKCGAESRTRFSTCPACGERFEDAAAPARRRRPPWPLVALLVVLAGAGTWMLVDRANQRAADERERLAALATAERARLARIQAPKRGAAPHLRGRSDARAARAALVRAVERSITRDAAARARKGELDGPISETRCGPLLKDPEAVPDHRVLSRSIGRYDCVAIRRDVRNTTRSVAKLGYAFVAALDFDDFTYVWCRNTPAQGERGEALAFVRLERPCLAAKGRALGTGYVDVPTG